MIAGNCRAEIDMRLPLGVTRDGIEGRVQAIVPRYPEASYRFIKWSEPAWTDPDHDAKLLWRP